MHGHDGYGTRNKVTGQDGEAKIQWIEKKIRSTKSEILNKYKCSNELNSKQNKEPPDFTSGAIKKTRPRWPWHIR